MSDRQFYAFPSQSLGVDGLPDGYPDFGMTYRQWLIGQALNGVLASGVAGLSYDELADSVIGYADRIVAKLESASNE